jgi:hypothetical protein
LFHLMREWLNLLYQNSGIEKTSFNYGNELSFFFDDNHITIRFKIEDAEDDLEFDEEDYDLLFYSLENLSVEHFKISITEFLTYRQDFEYNPGLPISVANTTIALIRKLTEFSLTIVKDYSYEVHDTSDGFCGAHYEYSGAIYIDYAQVNFDTVRTFIEMLNNIKIESLTELYVRPAAAGNKLKNSFVPQFINTNTKVRRLGYLKIFTDFMLKRKRVPETFLNKRFEEFALPYSEALSSLKNNKGIILNLKGNSAEPYVTLLKELDLITTINRVVVPTKWLKTYMVIREANTAVDENIFQLGYFDKLFFLELLLKKDFLYSSVILDYLSIHSSVIVNDLIAAFKDLLLSRLRKLIVAGTHEYGADVTEYRVIEKRVAAWKKAEVYLEHIILPRINWMADLGLISLDDNQVSLLEAGNTLIEEINYWIDLKSQFVSNSEIFLEHFYTASFSKAYIGAYGVYPAKKVILQNVTEYLKKSFTLFQTLAPNRVTASQAITYTKYMLLVEKKYAVSAVVIIRFIENELSDSFIYKYQPRYADGYIQQVRTNIN